MLRRPRLLFLLALAALLASVAPAAAADSGLIVFQGNRGDTSAIYSVNPGGGGAEVITTGRQPSVSRDGKTIVFLRGDDIWTIGINGANARKVYSGSEAASDPAVSANGKRVAFAMVATGPVPDPPKIWAIDIDGTDLQLLTKGRGIQDSEPSFSPDGRRISFIRSTPESAVMTMTASGTDLTAVTKVGDNPFNDPFTAPKSPSYSPNGARIVFGANGRKTGLEIYACDSDDGRNRVELTKGDARGSEPAYSPDGNSIVFQRGRNIFTMDADGSGVKQTTFLDDTPGFANLRPSWGR